MTITPTPEQERTLAQAMEDGLIQRPEEALDLGLDTLRSRWPLDDDLRPLRNGSQDFMPLFTATQRRRPCCPTRP